MPLSRNSTGRLLAATLAGSWRGVPPPPELSAEGLSTVAPLLVGSGAGPLGWWKIRGTHLADTRAAQGLRQTYRYHALQSAVRERSLEQIFSVLDAARVDALLVKGWAAARVYAEPWLRPSGDIDVCVRPAQFARAARALEDTSAGRLFVDLHAGCEKADERSFDELYARASRLRLGGAEVRVPCAEDHLRLMCIHLLRHGAWRPLWLCDVAAALESRARDFDRARLLCGDGRRARWVTCAVGLARELLGARVDDTPLARESRRLPRWLVPEVLRQWETPFSAMQAPMRHRAPMRKYLRRPRGALRDLLNRWPNPIEATVGVGGPFNEWPRLPFQLGHALSRTARFLVRVPEALREQD